MPTVTVEVPATTANLGPGFDCVGLALGLHNRLSVTPLDEPRWEVEVEGHGAGELPSGEDHLAVQAMQRVFALVDEPPRGACLVQDNSIPLCSGLGSSSAAIVGGLAAANELCGRPLDLDGLAGLAARIEGHPDNVAPAVYGGLVVVVDDGELSCVRFEPPPGLTAVVASPELRVLTHEARRALPPTYPKADAVFSVTHAALLVAALVAGDRKALRAALHDRLHQPYRLKLIRGGSEVLEAAREAGALGAVISGSGPTLLAFCDDDGQAVAAAMRSTWAAHGVAAEVRPVPPAGDGVRIVAAQ